MSNIETTLPLFEDGYEARKRTPYDALNLPITNFELSQFIRFDTDFWRNDVEIQNFDFCSCPDLSPFYPSFQVVEHLSVLCSQVLEPLLMLARRCLGDVTFYIHHGYIPRWVLADRALNGRQFLGYSDYGCTCCFEVDGLEFLYESLSSVASACVVESYEEFVRENLKLFFQNVQIDFPWLTRFIYDEGHGRFYVTYVPLDVVSSDVFLGHVFRIV